MLSLAAQEDVPGLSEEQPTSGSQLDKGEVRGENLRGHSLKSVRQRDGACQSGQQAAQAPLASLKTV